jgi:hypothetical protein
VIAFSRIARNFHHARCLIAVATLVLLAPVSGAAATASAGASPTKPALKAAPARASRPPRPQPSPFVGRGMWIWDVSQSDGGNLASIVATARSYGISTVIIKAGDGTAAWSQFNSEPVAVLHAGGLKVCAWQYVYGDHPIYEAAVGASAVRAGADCLLIDAESEYQGKYVQAQEYLKKLRELIGSGFPVGLAGFPYVDYHPGFPYSVFVGAAGAQYNVPQMYWPDIGASVDAMYAHTYEFNWLYQRPIEPLGELSAGPPAWQVVRFRQLSKVFGASLVSWWDWQSASAAEWRAIARPFSALQGYTLPSTMPVLGVASAGGIWAGDLVVWAQEHLLEAGEAVQIDGDYGAQTQLAVEQFQAAHGLPVTGEVDPATWKALLRYPRPHVSWSTQQGKAAAIPVAGAARETAGLPVPWSARLPAIGDEIPPHLGAGRAPR